jgi:hypothetical protein
MLSCLGLAMASCGGSRPPVHEGEYAKVSGLIACAGSADAADALYSDEVAAVFKIKSKEAATSDAFRRLRESKGFFLQEKWIVQFGDATPIDGHDYLAVKVAETPDYQRSYIGSSCWLASSNIDSFKSDGSMSFPVDAPKSKVSVVASHAIESQSKTLDQTTLLPGLGMSRAAVERRLSSLQVFVGGGVERPHIYTAYDASGNGAQIDLGYAVDHKGVTVLNWVKLSTGRSGNPLSGEWRTAFAKAYPYDPTPIPHYLLTEQEVTDTTPEVGETISIHRMRALAESIDATWHSGDSGWTHSSCPQARPTDVEVYSSNPKTDIEIYSEFLVHCIAASLD